MHKEHHSQVVIDGEVAYVGLLNGGQATVEVEDVHLAEGYRWRQYTSPRNRTNYAVSSESRGGWTRTIYMHRLILGTPAGRKTDHKDGDGLNNRRSNLRVASNQQNMENRPHGANSNSKTGVRGVSAHKCKPSGMMWCARANSKGHKPLARYFPFTDEGFTQACAAVVELRKQLHTHADGR